MTEQEYVSSLLSQNERLLQDNIKLNAENNALSKKNKHLKRVIKGYKENSHYNNHKRKSARREFYR